MNREFSPQFEEETEGIINNEHMDIDEVNDSDKFWALLSEMDSKEKDDEKEVPNKGGYENFSIKDMEPNLEGIISQLKEKIDSGYFELIIGDDASGRVPALILKKVFDKIYTEKGFEKPDLKFFAGAKGTLHKSRRDQNQKDITELAKQFGKPGAKTLLVTEYLKTGLGLQSMANALKDAGLDVEIATLSEYPESLDMIKKNLPFPIHSGDVGYAPDIYGEYQLGGVIKNSDKPGAPYAKLFKPGFWSIATEQDVRDAVKSTRRDINIAANKLVENYNSEESEK